MSDPPRRSARSAAVRALVVVLLFAGSAHAEERWFASADVGLNTSHPFGELQLGHHWAHVPFEMYLDYSYDAHISQYAFQTFGVGARTYVMHVGNLRVFLQTLAGAVLSSGPGDFGDRASDGIFEQGLGMSLDLVPGWAVKAAVSTGYPVHVRSEVGMTFRW
jgi:hypothetical protein